MKHILHIYRAFLKGDGLSKDRSPAKAKVMNGQVDRSSGHGPCSSTPVRKALP